MTTPRERFLTAGELSGELQALGIRPAGYRACLEIIRHCDRSIGTTLRLSDALEYLRVHTVRPASKDPHKRAPTRKKTQTEAIVLL